LRFEVFCDFVTMTWALVRVITGVSSFLERITSDIHLVNAYLLSKKPFFLFGLRARGKSTLIKQQLSNSAKVIDLLDSRLYLRLLYLPHLLISYISMHNGVGHDGDTS